MLRQGTIFFFFKYFYILLPHFYSKKEKEKKKLPQFGFCTSQDLILDPYKNALNMLIFVFK